MLNSVRLDNENVIVQRGKLVMCERRRLLGIRMSTQIYRTNNSCKYRNKRAVGMQCIYVC
jgi:hypothetical protein